MLNEVDPQKFKVLFFEKARESPQYGCSIFFVKVLLCKNILTFSLLGNGNTRQMLDYQSAEKDCT
jgi:hypothetical protein